MTYKTRKWLSLLVLILWLPIYIGVALYVISLFERPTFIIELLIYVGLGIAWALPFRSLFRGVGKADPDAPDPELR